MKTILLKRIALNEYGTFGVMIFKEIPFCCTYELQWIMNKQNISCIPQGEYLCERYESSKRGKSYLVSDVPGRTGILIHIGNNKKDTLGCILPGEKYEPIGHEISVQESRKAFDELMGIIEPDKQFILKIMEV